MAAFEHVQTVACSVEALFDFLTRPANIVRLSEPESQLEFLEAPDVIATGSELEFEVRAYGQTQSIVHEIVAVERPRRIFERMLHGPLEELEHEHLFDGDERQTQLIDRITFVPPRGMFGLLLTEARLRASFEKSFAHQRAMLEQLVAAGELR